MSEQQAPYSYHEKITLEIHHGHASFEQVIRLASSFINHRLQLHPCREATNVFNVVAVFEDRTVAGELIDRLSWAVPGYVPVQAIALGHDVCDGVLTGTVDGDVSYHTVLTHADIFVTDSPEIYATLSARMQNPIRSDILVHYLDQPIEPVVSGDE